MSESSLVDRALQSLEAAGVHGTVTRSGKTGDHDRITLSRADREATYVGIVRRTLRPSSISVVADQARALPDGPAALVISEHISAETADLLRERGLQFIDAAGNAYLDTPDFLVAITGRRAAVEALPPFKDHVGPAAWQVAFVLLREPDAAHLSVRALGERAGVSHGAAAVALRTFDARGWLSDLGRSGHHLTDVQGMLSGWLTGFADRLAPKLEIARAMPPGTDSPAAWARAVASDLSPDSGLLGGEAAAEFAAHDLRGTTASVYVRRWDAPTMKRLRLMPSPRGTVSVRSAFAPHIEDPSDPRLVDPLIVLAELYAIPDERLDATRAALQKSVLSRIAR